MHRNVKDITGKRFGLLIVESYSHTKARHSYWKCVCDCGGTKTCRANSLQQGATTSCGCVGNSTNFSHGLTKHPLFPVWSGMKQRCSSHVSEKYKKHYYSKGIRVCRLWKNSFLNFFNWAISNGWEKGKQIDRINNNGNYSPSNCRFVTPAENCNNKSSNHRITFLGRTQTITQWSREKGIKKNTLLKRINTGLSVKEALNKPVLKR